MIAVGGAHEAPSRLDTQVVGLHHPRNALVVDQMAATMKLVRDTPVTVTRQVALNFPDELGQLFITDSA